MKNRHLLCSLGDFLFRVIGDLAPALGAVKPPAAKKPMYAVVGAPRDHSAGFSLTGKEMCGRDDPDRADFLWREYGRLARDQGLTWGGDFRSIIDRPHVQLVYGGLSLRELCELYQQGGLKLVWQRFDQIQSANAMNSQSSAEKPNET